MKNLIPVLMLAATLTASAAEKDTRVFEMRTYYAAPGKLDALNAEHVAHEFVVVAGPHDYAFNRGPGGIEMLLWHDRVLRGEPAI